MKRILVIALIAACNLSFVNKYEKEDNGIKIEQGDSLTIKIEFLDNAIVRVKKHRIGTDTTIIPNYPIVLENQNTPYKVKESKGKLKLSTSKLNVYINEQGIISFYSAKGQKLTKETSEFLLGNQKYKVSQSFEAGDEALYGLGQYQSGVLNWKNVPIRMMQTNQEVAVPFLASTKGYGIYWNNYSVTDFNPTQYEILFEEPTTRELSEVEEETDGEREDVANRKLTAKQSDNIRETTFTPKKTGVYTFLVESNKTTRMRANVMLSFDADTVINYSTIWAPTSYHGTKYMEADKEYKVVFRNSGAQILGNVYYNEPDYNKSVFASYEGKEIDYYFVGSGELQEVIALNNRLTGMSPMFDKKAYGFWQCRERYHNQQEILENARQMRERKIPFDIIVQDWFYWPKGTKGPQWDREKYPDPKAMVQELKDMNLNLLVSVWPQVTNNPLLERYDLLNKKLKDRQYIDIYNEQAQNNFYKMLSDSMFHLGVYGIWLDGSEPENKPDDNSQVAVGRFAEVANPYSLLVSKSVYEGRREEFPDERVLNLTRSGFTGQQRYGSVVWSGDVAATWEQFSEQIPAGLNFTMAGLNYWTHDIGGFFRDSNSLNPTYKSQYTDPEYIELLTRWFQFGSLCPIFRLHGYRSETEIWRYTKEFEDIARKFIDLRYQLIPYIYSEAWKATSYGHLIMSPLAYKYQDDPKVWGIKNQYLFGESMMVGIVTKYKAREMDLYLPEGQWYDYWTDTRFDGAKEIVADAPLNRTPIYVKAGSILPLGPKIQHTDEHTDEPIRIKIYPGKDASYVLYMDDKRSYDYENGEYTEIEFKYSEKKRKLEVSTLTNEYYNFDTSDLKFKIEIAGEPATQTLIYKGKKQIIKL